MRPLKLAIVVGAFPKLSETFVLHQIEHLLALGHDVRIFAFHVGNERAQHPSVARLDLLSRTTYLKSPDHVVSKLRALWPWRTRRGSGETFDAIICHFGHIGERARALRKQGVFQGPLVVIFHAYDVTVWLKQKGRDAYRGLFAEARLLLPISEHWAHLLCDLGAAPERIRVLHMGVDGTDFEYRRRSIAHDEPLRFLSVGRLVEKKGFRHAIVALALARPKLGRNFHYVIGGDGPLLTELKLLVEQQNLSPWVSFVGPLTNLQVQERMAEAHALLVPSVTAADGDMEGIPVVLMEAMAQGLPVLTTAHSGIPELVRNADTGWCVPEGDATALARAIVEFAEAPERWSSVTDRARQVVETDFNAVLQAEHLVEAVRAIG